MTAWIFVLTLAFCDPGQRVTNQFEEFGEELSRCDWYSIPIEIQRIYLIFLSDTQQPKIIQSYGGIACTRDTCKKVIFNEHENKNDIVPTSLNSINSSI